VSRNNPVLDQQQFGRLDQIEAAFPLQEGKRRCNWLAAAKRRVASRRQNMQYPGDSISARAEEPYRCMQVPYCAYTAPEEDGCQERFSGTSAELELASISQPTSLSLTRMISDTGWAILRRGGLTHAYSWMGQHDRVLRLLIDRDASPSAADV
jgi:hypothetical protein